MIRIKRVCVWMIWAIILILPPSPLSLFLYNNADSGGPTAMAKPDFIAL